MLLRKVSWQEIEALIDALPVTEPIDEVVGIRSGGAFISRCVAQKNHIAKISYVRSSYWSASTVASNIAKIVKHLSNKPVSAEVEFPEGFHVEDKVVLLVDDTICTSVTTHSIADKLYKMKAKKVLRYTLFCNSAEKAEYIGQVSGAPIIWPWGWEAD